MNKKYLHKDFKWNGISFSTKETLFQFVDKDFPEISIFIREWFDDSGVIHCKTSGSTGIPKEIGLDRLRMMNSAQATGNYFSLGPESRALLCLPLGYIAGKMMLIRAMVLGWHLDSIDPSSTPEIPRHVTYDFSAMVPLQLTNSLDQLKHIKTLIVGGGEVPSLLRPKIANLKTKIFATYGMTETITHIALMPLNKSAGFSVADNHFKGLPGVRFSTDPRQCLRIQVPYISEKEIVTNDMVELISETRFKWVGRYDNIINSGGVKLIPELIEEKFRDVIKGRFFFTAVPDQVLGEKLVLIVEGEQENNFVQRLSDFQRQHSLDISKYEIPKNVYFTKKFKQTETGKVKRKASLELALPLK
jgi:O-succinylbenzoic acid--CoA ligase